VREWCDARAGRFQLALRSARTHERDDGQWQPGHPVRRLHGPPVAFLQLCCQQCGLFAGESFNIFSD
jgi:hypothetical protein